jgi:palmitoyl-protein thioesterase
LDVRVSICGLNIFWRPEECGIDWWGVSKKKKFLCFFFKKKKMPLRFVFPGLALALLCAAVPTSAAPPASVAPRLPVIIIKGLLDDAHSMHVLKTRIETAHPNTTVVVPDCFPLAESLAALWGQLPCFLDALVAMGAGPKHMVSVSQGGLVARAMLQTFAAHGVVNWVALSSPHAGQFGLTSVVKKVIPAKYQNVTREEAWHLFYTRAGQDTSVGGYWKDPAHLDLYERECQFLPVLNGEVQHPDMRDWRRNFLQVSHVATVGGPDDGVITPYWSAFWGFWDSSLTAVPMEHQSFYVNDTFGLRTLNERGGLSNHTFAGIQHFGWKESLEVFDKVIEPLLT